MANIPLEEILSGIPGIRAFAQSNADGAILVRSGEADAALLGAAPRLLHLAAELGEDLGLGPLREAELHGSPCALYLPRKEGTLSVEAESRSALADVSQHLRALLV
ncbi:MAG: hypothetical protein LPJ87_03665 [Zoogloeaceae bacterium]|nr:hypothetical protein [Zoogloeaceae bacterium]